MLAVGLAVLIPVTSLFLICRWWYESNEHGFHFPEPWRCLFSVMAPLFIAVYGILKRSLCRSGALAGLLVGFCLTISSLCFFFALLTFFICGSKATKYKSHLKHKLEEDFKEGGQRDWKQVISNGGVAAWLALVYVLEAGCLELPVHFSRHYHASWLGLAVLGSLACCCGDTFASEFGSVLGTGKPRLITTLRTVPRGTNGGISTAGVIASAVGGFLVGLAYYLAVLALVQDLPMYHTPPQWPLLLIGIISGMLGSAIDSFIGAIFQYSGYNRELGKIVETPGPNVEHISGFALFDNHSVNLVSSLVTAVVTPGIASLLVWPLLT